MATIIGLTGGIGSGKSTASVAFRDAGISIIDADLLSRELTGPHAPGTLAVARVFGRHYVTPDGAMDRARMRQLVFSNRDALQELENILHPLIARRIEEEAQARQHEAFLIFDCPLLYKKTLRPVTLSRILVIDAPDDLRLARIMTRPGITKDMAQQMMAAQPSRRAFLSLADDVILNAGSREDLRQAVGRYLAQLGYPSSDTTFPD